MTPRAREVGGLHEAVPEKTMKYCVDCKYFQVVGKKCTNPDFLDRVTKDAQYCELLRTTGMDCGREAKGFISRD